MLHEENLKLASIELRSTDEDQSSGEYLKVFGSPHIDGGYITAIANLDGDGTFY